MKFDVDSEKERLANCTKALCPCVRLHVGDLKRTVDYSEGWHILQEHFKLEEVL